MNINSELPYDLIEVIFSNLSSLKLLACRLVCKIWNNLISKSKFSPFFLFEGYRVESPLKSTIHYMDLNDANHLKQLKNFASFNFDYHDSSFVSIANSCNGLLCVALMKESKFNTYVTILNPMTNEFNIICKYECCYKYGFGFSLKKKQYKLVRMVNRAGVPKSVEIFSYGKWSPLSCCLPFGRCSKPHYFDGALYWIGQEGDNKVVICHLDLDGDMDEFERSCIIDHVESIEACRFVVGTLNGSLYASFCLVDSDRFQMWRMMQRKKNNYGTCENYSWIRVVDCFDLIPVSQFIKTFENGDILCLSSQMCTILYNPKTKFVRRLEEIDRNLRVFFVHQFDSFNFNSIQNIEV